MRIQLLLMTVIPLLAFAMISAHFYWQAEVASVVVTDLEKDITLTVDQALVNNAALTDQTIALLERVEYTIAKIQDIRSATRWNIIVFSLATFFIALIFNYVVSRKLLFLLKQATQFLKRMSEGERHAPLPLTRGDEMGKLFEQLGQVQVSVRTREDTLRQLEKIARIDALTGTCTRHYFIEKMNDAIVYHQAESLPLSLLLLDIDFFKKINDSFGHLVGDQVLKSIGKTLKATMRLSDTITRYGGEEFSVLMPNTNLQQALAVAERLRKAIELLIITIDGERSVRFTCSMGIAECSNKTTDAKSLLAAADEALYEAKNRGRNRIVTSYELTMSALKRRIAF